MITEVDGCEYMGRYEENFESPMVNVVIAGAQKSGTTSLKEYLRKHKKVISHDQKEFGYLVRDRKYKEGYEIIFEEYFGRDVSIRNVVLAKSVSVMYIREAMKRTQKHNDEIKITAVIRDPIERAYSAYWYMRQNGWETERNLEDAIKLERELKRKESLLGTVDISIGKCTANK
jgi:hypothetical protein